MNKLLLFRSFNNFYLENPDIIIFNNSTRQIFGLLYTYILSCSFQNMNSNSGSSIYINGQINILIECCLFENCSSIEKGGAIFFNSNSASCIINKNIASNCLIGSVSYDWTKGGQFSISTTSTGYKNEFLDNSVYKCSNNLDYTNCVSHFLSGGIIKLKNINSSNNYAGSGSSTGIYIYQSAELSFLNIINNYVSYHCCLGFQYGSGLVTFLNLINNTSPQYGIIHLSSTSISFNYCVCHSYSSKLFDLYSSSLSVSNSLIQFFTFSRGSGSTSNVSITIGITYQINIIKCNQIIISNRNLYLKSKSLLFLFILTI